jgi:hypothetical protein
LKKGQSTNLNSFVTDRVWLIDGQYSPLWDEDVLIVSVLVFEVMSEKGVDQRLYGPIFEKSDSLTPIPKIAVGFSVAR